MFAMPLPNRSLSSHDDRCDDDVEDGNSSSSEEESSCSRRSLPIQQSIHRLTTHPTMKTEVISSSEDCGKTNMKRWSIFESLTRTRLPISIKIPSKISETRNRRRGRNTSALVWNNVDHSCHYSWFSQMV
jgi:hypothetical protein